MQPDSEKEERTKNWQDYMNINKDHPQLSLELVEAERKTRLCIKEWLHVNAWKHRMNGDKEAMQECHKLAVTALRQSRTYDHILKIILN